MKWLKWSSLCLLALVGLIAVLLGGGYFALTGAMDKNLPKLDGEYKTIHLKQEVRLSRDSLGQAVIHANERNDALYALGFAHGQDRFFQMDLLRRKSAGSLAELMGSTLQDGDIKARFHQFFKRSRHIFSQLPKEEASLLEAYAAGVNDAIAHTAAPFEYIAHNTDLQPWHPADSFLVIFSMYMDLQKDNLARDQVITQIKEEFGAEMVAFMTQPNNYQAALDGSEMKVAKGVIPALRSEEVVAMTAIERSDVYGSNNWAVSGKLTPSGQAMVSDDMHLGLNVPTLWYRAQLNYFTDGKPWQITGVTLPGVPGVVVGSNGYIAWSFTNSFVDTADWVILDDSVKTHQEVEKVPLGDGEFYPFEVELSEYGPVKTINGKRYALSWVAHKDYAVNARLFALGEFTDLTMAMANIADIGMPAQNFVAVDSQNNIGWSLIGAIPARTNPSNEAILPQEYSLQWQNNRSTRPIFINPEHGRVWSANARTVSVDDLLTYGDGGYVIGARAQQIRDRLFEKYQFTEADFYKIQLDNEARYFKPWHKLLLSLLERNNKNGKYAEDISYLKNWQQCACPSSVGFTLVAEFIFDVTNTIWAPVESQLKAQGLTLKTLVRNLDPASWQLIEEQPKEWLNTYPSWDLLLLNAYHDARNYLVSSYGDDMARWNWGRVNEAKIQHPFSMVLPPLAVLLDMPSYPGHGGGHMPAVQGTAFGASQRFIARPGALEQAIMTIPGGQSGNPKSAFYRAGFTEFSKAQATPLLPGKLLHTLKLKPE